LFNHDTTSAMNDPGLRAPFVNRLTWRNRAARAAWAIARTFLFRPSPRILHGWRRLILRGFGARLGKGVMIHPSCRIWAPWNLVMGDDSSLSFDVDCYNVDMVTIGAHVSVSQYVLLCTASHDLEDPDRKLVTAPVTLQDASWIFARAYIGPGVTIGEGAVVAACAVVAKAVPPWTVVAGNPAKEIKTRTLRQ
jgi:putative colanic acid biosynthesis acetyltransferase WcaF